MTSPLPLPDGAFAASLRASPLPPSHITSTAIHTLNLLPHPEGGYFSETDRSTLLIPSPFNSPADLNATRHASTTIYYLLTPDSPVGHFHRNKARTVHTLHRGRGRYVLIHEDGGVETFVVGGDLGKGEKLQWIVEGGKWKASYLLEDVEGGAGSEGGLLISETVVPGFEFRDHDFLTGDGLRALLGVHAGELSWLLKKGEREGFEAT